MAENITAEIISIGTEILLGEITDTNSVYIARQLRDIGVNVYYMTSVGDNRGRIADSIRLALGRANVVITCGGLGPTVDDMTRQAVADATERGLVFQQALLDQISARFKSFKAQMTDNNRRQAFIPADATVIENPVGTAPSFAVDYQGGVVISLPGVPREMKYLMTERVIPMLQSRYQLGIIKARILRTAGIGESMLDDLIGVELLEASNPTIGLAAHNGQVDVRVTAKAETLTEAEAMIDRVVAILQPRIQRYVFGYDDDRLEAVLMQAIRQHGTRLLVWEAGMGGVIGSVLRDQQGQGAAVVSFADPDAMRRHLDLPIPPSHRELASQALVAARRSNEADLIIIVISRPDIEESADSDETTVVMVAKGEQVRQRSYGFGGKSELARHWVTTWALASAWWLLRERADA
jgi:nicotinamide-nucleotide amidase